MEKTINVLVVDDHDLVREGILRILNDAPGIKVIAEAVSGEEAIELVARHSPDVVTMDITMPGMGGLEATRILLETHPELPIVILSVHDEEPYPSRLLQAGAMGYLTKGCAVGEMHDAIKSVATGVRFIGTDIAQRLALSKISGKGGSPFDKLSQREMQVLLMITQGKNTQEISDKLCLSPKTVSTYRYRLYEKISVQNDVELTHVAIREGIIEDEDKSLVGANIKCETMPIDITTKNIYPYVVGGLMHDARNSIVAVQYRVNKILDEVTGGPGQRSLQGPISAIQCGIGHLQRTLELVQQLSRPYYSNDSAEEADPTEIIESILAEYRSLNPTIQFDLEFDEGTGELSRYTPGIVSFLVAELLENARKACSALDNAMIHLSIEATGTGLIITCEDTGVGFHDEMIDRILSGSISPPTSPTAQGFGLYFIKEIVGRLDGEMLAKNNTDRGATMQIILPILGGRS